MDEAKPEAMNYLRNNHFRIWSRSQFLTHCKVHYVTNNLAESFNNWIKKFKALNLDDFMDKIRQLLMIKWDIRNSISKKIKGLILPHIIKKLKEQSRNLDMDVFRNGDQVAVVCVKGSNGCRCVVKLDEKTCSCREWQVRGIPCSHAIAFITMLREPLENYVDLYYSVDKFRAAYENLIPSLPDKSQWPKSDHGFFMHPPLLKSTAGRRRKQRFRGCTEGSGKTTHRKGQHQCPICKGYGHRWYNCKDGDPEDIAAMQDERGPPKKRRKKAIKPSDENNIVPIESTPSGPVTMYFSPSQECTTKLSSRKSIRSGSGSNQLEALSIEFPMPTSRETTPQPAATSQPREKKKSKGKAKAAGKNKKKLTSVQHDSPAMGTRSKAPKSPAQGTRSKRKILD